MLLPFYCFVWFAFTKESFESDLEKLSLQYQSVASGGIWYLSNILEKAQIQVLYYTWEKYLYLEFLLDRTKPSDQSYQWHMHLLHDISITFFLHAL